MLRWCQQFVTPKSNQFGGQKGCSTYHFLAETWDDITDHLEDSRAASILTAIDYSKAFNRVEHLPLLNTFANKGAPTQLIQILAGFLSKHTMSVKLGMARSEARPVNAGAPQGSVLGTYVFNVATDELEEAADLVHDTARENYELNEDDLAFLETETSRQNAHSTPIRDQATLSPPAVSPVHNDSLNFVVLNTVRNVPPNLTNRIEPSWRSKPVNVRKFVDDNLQTEKLSMRNQQTYFKDGILFKNPRVARSEHVFRHIISQTEKKGLLVNAGKTTLLAVSAAKSYETRAHIYDDQNQRVDNSGTLKALGFTFNSKGDVSTQVDILAKKFRKKVWSLRHLRKSGLRESELLRVYEIYIRPTVEYSAPIYHPMLTGAQETQLERLQFFALKNIYGFMYSHRELLNISKIATLKQRREEICFKFAKKTAANPRFSAWFPTRTNSRVRKNKEHYVEMNVRTDRRKNSPIFYYRRILNEDRISYTS